MKNLFALMMTLLALDSYACLIQNGLRYCRQDRVIYNSSEVTLFATLPNGTAKVKYQNNSDFYDRSIEDLAVTSGCTRNGYCVGQEVIYSSSLVTITGIMQNGDVKVQYRNNSDHYTRKTEDLAVLFGCVDEGFCVGDRAIYSSSLITIHGIHPNGNVKVRYRNNSDYYDRDPRELAYTTGCNDFDYCVGDEAIYGSSLVTIAGIQQDNNVKVRYRNNSDYYTRDAMELAILDTSGRQSDFRRYPELGYSFKARALNLAESLIQHTRSIEGYLTNSEEVDIDAIKSKAIRLRSKINSQASISEVRTAMFELWQQLQLANYYFDEAMETDNLVWFAESFLTSQYSLNEMIRFLDQDFSGHQSQLY